MVYYYSNMKKLITFVYLIFTVVSGIAQVDSTDYAKKETPHKSAADRVSASINMGTGVAFTNSRPSSAALGIYIAPVIGYQLTQKFKLNFAFVHYYVNGGSYINNGSRDNLFLYGSPATYSGNLVQLGGQYQVNPKTMLSGGVLYNLNTVPSTQNNYKGATLGIDYKLTPHSIISVRTTVIQGNTCPQPYLNDPFGQNQMAPFGPRSTLFNSSSF